MSENGPETQGSTESLAQPHQLEKERKLKKTTNQTKKTTNDFS